ncbi:MAG: DUF3800 domain-containing protein [Arcobacter sp.]|nr:DUF3800 domain-containing protein [Arcobacter sp.]
MRKLYIFLDESGLIHKNSSDEYFIIGGFITEDYTKLKRLYKNATLKIKKQKNIPLKNELKASNMNKVDKRFILEEIQKDNLFKFIGIMVNKPKLRKPVNETNIFYNYLIKILLDYLIDKNIIQKENELYIAIDKRSIKVSSLNSLEDYLKIHYIYEKNFDIELKTEYLDSHDNYNIQIADLICNTLWVKYTYPNTDEVSEKIDFSRVLLKDFPY